VNVRRALSKTANALLSRANLRLTRIERDFDARLETPGLQDRLFAGLAEVAENFLRNQCLFAARVPDDLLGIVSDFYREYLKTPFRERSGGSRFNNLLWLFLISRAYEPEIIVDSGTFKGASAWAMSLGAPAAQLFSFDINLSTLSQRVRAEYIEADWTSREFGAFTRGLCYFDDHVDQARRVLEAARAGFPLAIFDDDFSVTSFAGMAHGGEALPKVEFVLDAELRRETEIAWTDRGIPKRWTVDVGYLDRAQDVIEETARLPNTSLITGIHQTPYRIVKLKAAR
jgi:hypothetical protein